MYLEKCLVVKSIFLKTQHDIWRYFYTYFRISIYFSTIVCILIIKNFKVTPTINTTDSRIYEYVLVLTF